jgi:hypothetical protein
MRLEHEPGEQVQLDYRNGIAIVDMATLRSRNCWPALRPDRLCPEARAW